MIVQDKLMDKELKPPYMPPKEKIISDHEIEKQAILEKLVIEEIKVIIFKSRSFNNFFKFID